MTKFAVVGLSEGLAVYLRDRGIGVTMICPGMVSTNIGSASALFRWETDSTNHGRNSSRPPETNFRQGKLPDFITDFISSRIGPSAARPGNYHKPRADRRGNGPGYQGKHFPGCHARRNNGVGHGAIPGYGSLHSSGSSNEGGMGQAFRSDFHPHGSDPEPVEALLMVNLDPDRRPCVQAVKIGLPGQGRF